jgi:rhodanese-related sulfurtransferase
MKKLYFSLALILVISACQYQQPDYFHIITANDLNQLLQHEDIFLMDVHTPEQKHIKGTTAVIPYDQIEKNLDQLPKDKDTAIYLYCEGGPMGSAAAKSLYALGYHNLSNLEGGIKAWQKAGFGVE